MNQNYQERPEVLPIDLDTFAKNLQNKEPAVYIADNGFYTVHMQHKTGRAISLSEHRKSGGGYEVSFPKMKLPISPEEFENEIFHSIFREFLGYSRHQYAIPTGLTVQDQIRMCRTMLEAMHDVQITGQQALAVHPLCAERFRRLGLSEVTCQICDNVKTAVEQWHADRELLDIVLSVMIVE